MKDNEPRVPAGFAVTPFDRACLPEALRIEAGSFSEPWSLATFEALFFPPTPTAVTLAAVTGEGKLAAYAGAQVLFDEAEILNIAVAPEYRRRGLARALMTALDRAFVQRGVSRAYLEVRRSNLPAHTLYLSLGYREIGVRRNYYTSPVEDAIVMVKEYEEGCFGC